MPTDNNKIVKSFFYSVINFVVRVSSYGSQRVETTETMTTRKAMHTDTVDFDMEINYRMLNHLVVC